VNNPASPRRVLCFCNPPVFFGSLFFCCSPRLGWLHSRWLSRMKQMSPLSRGVRFAAAPAADVARFTESLSFDWRLWRQDIRGSRAQAAMLRKIGVLSAAEWRAINRGLDAIAREIAAGKFRWRAELEAVHMKI